MGWVEFVFPFAVITGCFTVMGTHGYVAQFLSGKV